MLFRGIWQPNDFSQGLYAIWAGIGLRDLLDMVQTARIGGLVRARSSVLTAFLSF